MSNHPSNRVTLADLDNVFRYHNDPSRYPKYDAIRAAAKEMARAILENCPDCADRAAAIRQIRECMMTANAAIAIEPLPTGEEPA
jgi:hypothetical protein